MSAATMPAPAELERAEVQGVGFRWRTVGGSGDLSGLRLRAGTRYCIAYHEDREELRAWVRAVNLPEGWVSTLGGAWPGLPVVFVFGGELSKCRRDDGPLAFLQAAWRVFRAGGAR